MIIKAFKNRLYRADMALISGADEIVITDVEYFPKVLNAVNNMINVLLRGYPCLLSPPLYFLTMLISAGQEKDTVAFQAVIACEGVCGNC